MQTARLTLRKFEALDGALNAYLYAERASEKAETSEVAQAEIRATNRLFDALVDVDGYTATDALGSNAQLAERAAHHVVRFLCAA